MGRASVIRKFVRAGAHIGYSVHPQAATMRDYLLNLEQVVKSRYETLFAIRECFRKGLPFCVIEEGKRDLVLSKKTANILSAYKTIKVRP